MELITVILMTLTSSEVKFQLQHGFVSLDRAVYRYEWKWMLLVFVVVLVKRGSFYKFTRTNPTYVVEVMVIPPSILYDKYVSASYLLIF